MKNANAFKAPISRRGFALLFVTLAAAILLTGGYLWSNYRSRLMKSQEDQMLLTAKSLGISLSASLQEYGEDVQNLCQVYDSLSTDKALFHAYLDTHDSRTHDICLLDSEGVQFDSLRGTRLEQLVPLGVLDGNCLLEQYTIDSRHYLGFRRTLENGGSLCLLLDEEAYYEELLSDLKVGTNGYLVVKNAQGRIIMHPDLDQWGIDVIEGRRAMFPDADFSSLEAMIQKQLSEPAGVYEYESYWWTDPELPRVRKISAHSTIDLNGDRWTVSAAVDYSDFYAPIEAGLVWIVLLMVLSSLLMTSVCLYILRLQYKHKKDKQEIQYLRELNDMLEEVHKQEESMAHQQRLQMMGVMTGGIAHEFNNFLTPILGYAELLMDDAEPDSETYDSAHEIYEAADKAKDVVRQISAMSRKNVETVYKMTPAKQTLRHTAKMIESVCPPQVHFVTQLDGLGEESFLGNRTQIDQVLLNLCVNGIHAIGRQEGILVLRADAVPQETVARCLPDVLISQEWERYVRIQVVDTGCGMTEDTMRHIFEPFFTTKKAGEGTGLGLSLAEQIIHAHRGQITVESKPGEGTAFTLFLPVAPQDAAEPLEWGQNQQLRIVLADDNAKVLELLKNSLKKLGLTPETCTRQEALRQLLQRVPTDVLAIDCTLEDGDGIEFCMSIQGLYPDMLKILMVDSVTREVVEARRRGVIAGYVIKPVSDTTLLAAIREARTS
ncbi:MAG: ATP-binding protein [Faecalibacterium sp.]